MLMINEQNLILILLSFFSIVIFALGIYLFTMQLTKKKGKSTLQKLYPLTICTFFSIVLLRYVKALYSLISLPGGNENEGLHWFEGFLNSMVHTLQTFSLDEEYTETILIIKEFFEDEIGSDILAGFFGAYTAFLNVFAPIIGGAFLLGILTSVFPRFRLGLKPFRKKYIFSELNERAVVFAEDIVREAINEKKKSGRLFFRLPVIVFTDVYVSNDDETGSELLQRANEMGAICIKNDILTMTFRRTKELFFILLDDDEMSNLHTLTTLTTEKEKRWNENCLTHIYVFSNIEETGTLIRQIYKKNELKNVIVKVVREYSSIVHNLLHDVPLYSPLLAKYPQSYSGEKELSVTIIGGGLIGTEAFLATYWCGQMLDCKLTINVVTKQVDEFVTKINNINPEVLLTGVVDGIESEKSKELLRIYPNREIYSAHYANFNFINIKSDQYEIFENLTARDESGIALLDSDYFIIALGADELNMSIAKEISRKITLDIMDKSLVRKPVVAYSLYDSNIKEVVNSYNTTKDSVYLYAFAAMRDVYSCANIFMNNVGEAAFNFSNIHTKKDMEKFLKDEYGWRSSIARIIHRPYKIYSLGLIEPIKDRESLGTITETENDNYIRIINSDLPDDIVNSLKLAWLEHRRWNAFLRINGFVSPTEEQLEKYAYSDPDNDVKHKNLDLKLHPCIVESTETFNITDEDWDDLNYTNNNKLDRLDLVSIFVYQKEKEHTEKNNLKMEAEKNDYKKWDLPKYGEEKK